VKGARPKLQQADIENNGVLVQSLFYRAIEVLLGDPFLFVCSNRGICAGDFEYALVFV
jgi:hypothetical protein